MPFGCTLSGEPFKQAQKCMRRFENGHRTGLARASMRSTFQASLRLLNFAPGEIIEPHFEEQTTNERP